MNDDTKKAAVAKLWRNMELWRKFRRRTHLTAVLDANGSPCITLEQSANVLAEYWGSVFFASYGRSFQ
eukprot:1554278-Pyramimonas_sp.AAC.1